jgi:hypothetical protein
MNANLRIEIKAILNAYQEEMETLIADVKDDRKERTGCQEATGESREDGAKSRNAQSVVEHREVPKEEAAVKSSGAPKKWHGGWHLAPRRRGEPKEKIRRNCGSRKKLAAAGRR